MVVVILLIVLVGCSPPRFIKLKNVIESGTADEVRNTFDTSDVATSPIQVGSLPELYSYPLHIAVASGRLTVVKHFIDLGADPNATDHLGRTAFFEISRSIDEESMSSIVAELIEAGGNIDKAEPQFETTPLMSAANAGDGKTIRILLHHGADPTLANRSGRLALDQLNESRLENDEQRDEIRKLLQSRR